MSIFVEYGEPLNCYMENHMQGFFFCFFFPLSNYIRRIMHAVGITPLADKIIK